VTEVSVGHCRSLVPTGSVIRSRPSRRFSIALVVARVSSSRRTSWYPMPATMADAITATIVKVMISRLRNPVLRPSFFDGALVTARGQVTMLIARSVMAG
jgi:hypothetical protein